MLQLKSLFTQAGLTEEPTAADTFADTLQAALASANRAVEQAASAMMANPDDAPVDRPVSVGRNRAGTNLASHGGSKLMRVSAPCLTLVLFHARSLIHPSAHSSLRQKRRIVPQSS